MGEGETVSIWGDSGLTLPVSENIVNTLNAESIRAQEITFRYSISKGENMVKHWIERKANSDKALLTRLGEVTNELRGLGTTHNLILSLPKGPVGLAESYLDGSPKIRKSMVSENMARSGSLDKVPIDDGYEHSDRYKTRTGREYCLDVENGLRALRLNTTLTRFRKVEKPQEDYNYITIPLYLFLRLLGYINEELTAH